MEGLYEDLDFKLKVTRGDFESLVSDLFRRVSAPITTVIESASLTKSDIQSLVLVGGNTRIPMVQKVLEDLIGSDRMARNVNADEAGVMGAGFRAAGLSKLFRVKEIGVKDIHPKTVEIKYLSEPKPSLDESGRTSKDLVSKSYQMTLFNRNSLLGSKKLMLFRRQSNFDFTLEQMEISESEVK